MASTIRTPTRSCPRIGRLSNAIKIAGSGTSVSHGMRVYFHSHDSSRKLRVQKASPLPCMRRMACDPLTVAATVGRGTQPTSCPDIQPLLGLDVPVPAHGNALNDRTNELRPNLACASMIGASPLDLLNFNISATSQPRLGEVRRDSPDGERHIRSLQALQSDLRRQCSAILRAKSLVNASRRSSSGSFRRAAKSASWTTGTIADRICLT